MDLDHWKQLDSLLQSVLERPPEERDAFLRHACAGDEPLPVALRARFPSACAAALVAAWGRGPLPAPAIAALRELADPFVLTAAATALAARGARVEVLRAFAVDLPTPLGVAELAHGTAAERAQLCEALAWHQDVRAIELLAAGLDDPDVAVRRSAGAAVARVAGITVLGLFLCMLLSLPAIWQGATIMRALSQTLAIARSRIVEAILLLAVVWLLAFVVALIVFGVLAAGLMPTLGLSASILSFGDLGSMMGGMGGMGGFGGMRGMGGGGHVVAGGLGLGVLWAIAASLVAQVYLLGLCLVYLRVTEGLDLSATEAALRQKLDEARSRASDLGEKARAAASRTAAPPPTPPAGMQPPSHAPAAPMQPPYDPAGVAAGGAAAAAFAAAPPPTAVPPAYTPPSAYLPPTPPVASTDIDLSFATSVVEELKATFETVKRPCEARSWPGRRKARIEYRPAKQRSSCLQIISPPP